MTTPAPEVVAEILSGVTHVTRRVDIYESDGETLFYPNAPLVDGSVSVDASSTESRRNISLTLHNEDDALDRHPGGLWYDKIIKPYKGVRYTKDGESLVQEWQLGEFMIDNIKTKNFPGTIAIDGRDYAKKLINDKFGEPTTFAQYDNIIDTIKVIALNGGITKFDFSQVGDVAGKDFTFEPDDTRWKAVTDLAASISCELFFDPVGVLVCRPYQDPVLADVVFTFATGTDGTLASYEKTVGDGRLYNDVVVTGEGVDPPVVGRATVTDPNSPVNIERLGRRTYRYNSGFIYTQAQADLTALSFLTKVALEEYSVALESLNIPWIEAGDIIKFIDPDPDLGQGERFLLHDFSIGLQLGTSSINAKRVLAVG